MPRCAGCWINPTHVAAARLCCALGVFWWVRGHLAEAGRWAEQILLAPSLPPLAEARTRTVAGMAAFKQGDWARAGVLLTRSRTMFEELGERAGMAIATLLLGYVTARADFAQGRAMMAEAQACFAGHRRPLGRGAGGDRPRDSGAHAGGPG